MDRKKRIRGNLMLILTALIWGTGFVSQSLGMEYIGPFTFNCVRNIIASLFLIPCIWFLGKISGEKKQPMNEAEKKYLLKGGLYCGLALFVASSFQQIGIKYTTVGKAGFITALYVIIVPVLGIFMHKKVSAKIWVSMVIAVTGLYLLCINESISINKGDLFVLACAFAYSIHILVIDRFSPHTDGVKMSCIQFFVCGTASIIPSLIFETPVIADILRSMAPILYAAILSSGVAYTLQVVAQKDTDPVIASLILSLESVFSALSGWLVLNQKLSAKEIFGCALMFGAIILAQLPEKEKKI
jgi:drug/metabolite transporter (DMT)-like permease